MSLRSKSTSNPAPRLRKDAAEFADAMIARYLFPRMSPRPNDEVRNRRVAAGDGALSVELRCRGSKWARCGFKCPCRTPFPPQSHFAPLPPLGAAFTLIVRRIVFFILPGFNGLLTPQTTVRILSYYLRACS